MIVDPDAAGGEIAWMPASDASATAVVSRFAAALRRAGEPVGDDYASLWRWSVSDDRFWEAWAGFAGIRLGGGAGPVRTPDPMPATRWFPGRTLNFAEHVLEGRSGVALIAIAEDGTRVETDWEQLRNRVGAVAQHLRELGVRPGDRVAAILPNVSEAVIALLAVAAIGAVWSVCSPEFGAGAIRSRFSQLQPRVLIAAPGYRLNGQDRDRSGEIVEIIDALDSVEEVVWVGSHVDLAVPEIRVPAVSWEEIIADERSPQYAEMEFSAPLWVLFSSGTTGIPKGIVHGHGGALLEQTKLAAVHGDLGPGDRFLSVASTSWVVWNAMIGGLAVGASAVLLDGNPTHPSVDNVWRVAAETGTTVLGLSAGFVHACVGAGVQPGREHDLSTLRCVQVTGSVLSDDAYRWFYRSVGDIWLSSMSGGTDVASIFIGGVPTEPVRVGRIQVPALGVAVASWDEDGEPTDGRGELVVTAPMPSMPLHLWGDDGTLYRASYFDTYPGVWRHGDHIRMDGSGIRVLGRSDATLNRNGLRLGPADIYAAVECLAEVAEALVVGVERGTEYYMPLFVQLAPGTDEDAARAAVAASIRSHLSARYLPDDVFVVPAIPHTRTGKKLEVPVKRLFQGESLGDVVDAGAVDDAELLESFAGLARQRLAARS